MQRHRLIIISLLSMALLALELVWTRLFSAEFFYAYAFLVLSLAIMGLGLGALTLRLMPVLGRRSYMGVILTIAAAVALAGPPLVFRLGLKFSEVFANRVMFGKLAAAIVLLGLPYFFGGIGLAALFRRNHRDMARLYMADLIGAGVGVVLAVAMMNTFGTPATTFLIMLPMLAAAALAARKWVRLLPAVVAAAVIVLVFTAGRLLQMPREERAPVVHTHWDATSKIKVYEYAPQNRGINIDNAANTPVFGFDGDWDRPDRENFEFGIDVSNLIKRFDHCVFLSLGSGGGSDVLQALQAGATEIHAVEVNPYINKMMLTGELADFSGRIYHDKRVRVVTEDARAYVRGHKGRFDIIYALSSNTFAALASGSFALAENYLFTTEAFKDYWEAMTPDGFMMMEHQYYVPRLTSSLVDALKELKVPVPQDHFAIYDLPQMRRQMILLSKRPLTEELRYTAFGDLTEDNYDRIHLLFPAPDAVKDNLVNRIVTEGWSGAAPTANVDISPSTDNRPFVGQMGLWKNISKGKPGAAMGMDVFGYPVSKLIIVAIMAVVVVLALPLTLLPYLAKGPRLRAAPWLYFLTIGVAFMSVEVVLIQKYTLFVGPSVYSVSTILLTLLIASGIGSRLSPYVGARTAFALLIVWLLLEAFVFHHVTAAMVGMTMARRIAITVALVAPLGLMMGMPFPKGAARVGRLVDWGFAVNGAASVLGGAGILLVAMSFGFQLALLLAAALYFLAFRLISRDGAWSSEATAGLAPEAAAAGQLSGSPP